MSSEERLSDSVRDFTSFMEFLRCLPAPGMEAEEYLSKCHSFGEVFEKWLAMHLPDRSVKAVDWNVVAMLLEGASVRD